MCEECDDYDPWIYLTHEERQKLQKVKNEWTNKALDAIAFASAPRIRYWILVDAVMPAGEKLIEYPEDAPPLR